MEENEFLRAALFYRNMGHPVFPLKPHDKKPYVKWKKWQSELPSEDQIRKWWGRWPEAMIALVTGEFSGITVVDIDSAKGQAAAEEYLPDTLQTPIATSTRTGIGYHLYFKYVPGIPNKSRVLVDVDTRNDGGYVVAPPSSNGRKAYAWRPGLRPTDVDLAEMPVMLADILAASQQFSGARPSKGARSAYKMDTSFSAEYRKVCGDCYPRQQPITKDNKNNISFEHGTRDESLFHVANMLTKAGESRSNTFKILQMLASTWGEGDKTDWLNAKVKSAVDRQISSEKITMGAVREFVEITNGNFSITDAQQQITKITTPETRKKITVYLHRLAGAGVIERVPPRNGVFRRVVSECDTIDFLNADDSSAELFLPFGLRDLVNIMPGNIIVVAGEPDAGKTAFLLNIVRNNMRSKNVHYFSSEMGAVELRHRLLGFDDLTLADWNFEAKERSNDFHDVIKPGPEHINIIDFLEISDEFYKVGGYLTAMHDKLKGAVAIVALQKNAGQEAGLGGYRGLEKPRLYLTMSRQNTARIVKAKNWADPRKNPNGLELRYKIYGGCNLSQIGDWKRPAPDELKKRK